MLSTGEVVPGASYLNVDLVVYKNKDGFDLKPGSSGPGAQMAMRIFTKGGIPTAFASLDEVPADKPTNEDLYAYMRQVSNGWGAVVQHNVGEGHSRIWIAQAVASAGRLRLQWAALPN